MIACDDYKLIFVQIPHTASTDVGNFLVESMGGRRILAKHSLLPELRVAHPNMYRDYRIVGSTRNPLDERVSIYHKLLSDHGGRYSTSASVDGKVPSDRYARYIRRRILDEEMSFDEYFLKFCRLTFFSGLYFDRCRFDRVLRFESVGEDLENVVREVGYQGEINLRRQNVTQGKTQEFLSYYPDSIWGKAYQVFGRYCEDWGYDIPADWMASGRSKMREELDLVIRKISWVRGALRHRTHYH